MGKESILDKVLNFFNDVVDWIDESPGKRAGLIAGALVLLIILMVSCTAPAHAGQPADDGVHSSPETSLQGFVVQYAPVDPPALVFYWFTYDEAGEQAWFISDNVPLDAQGSEQLVSLYKPVGSFVDGDAAMGDPVGVLAISRQGTRITVRFGIAPIDGFTDGCAADLPMPPMVSPMPPPLPEDEYPCQGRLVLDRITPVIPELEVLP